MTATADMTAIIAGQGDLPAHLVASLQVQGIPCLVAELDGFAATVPGHEPIRFRIERLVPFLDHLADSGVRRVCFAGAVRRPRLEPELFDARTAALVPRLMAAIGAGDDGALRGFMALFEEWGFTVVGADEIAPDLLPAPGVASRAAPGASDRADAAVGEAVVAEMGRADIGQACVIAGGRVLAREGPDGTDAMLRGVAGSGNRRGLLFKAPKPGQDRRADLPLIGPDTARLAAGAGLSGIAIEAGGVMVVDARQVCRILDDSGLFLWVRPHGGGA